MPNSSKPCGSLRENIMTPLNCVPSEDGIT